MTWSDYVYAIIDWLERNEVVVHIHATELPVSGLYRSETMEIWVHESNAFIALLVLAHEAGHWLGYLIDEKPHSYQRERQAHVYGWYVLRWFDAPVSRETWRLFCRGSNAFHKQDNGKTELETRKLYWPDGPKDGPAKKPSWILPRCECGAMPDPSESPGVGMFEEDGARKFICLRCWQVYNGFPVGAPS